MKAPLDLVFLWHMHQPDYRDHRRGELMLPWVYLHVIKDYTDMAAHLERHPQIRAVVNFVPVLLEQIEDYADQFETGRFRDQLLQLLAFPDFDRLAQEQRQFLLNTCFRSNHTTMLAPFPSYQRLHELYLKLSGENETALGYLSGAYFADLITWYHLAWTGETERRRQPLLAQLMSKGEGYTPTDRQALLALIGGSIKTLIPRYRALAQRGQIEISCTPQTHPLAPLMIDFNAARESQSEAALPFAPSYPGGRGRVTAQIEAAQASHARRFGSPPLGMWPAEGAISDAFVLKLAAHDCRWIASGEAVLHASLRRAGIDLERAAYRPWRLASAPGLSMFFRDERLSDLIGFEYAKWYGQDAAQHFIAELEAIHAVTPAGEQCVVSIILDGENAWEHYPYNAHFFFEDLYAGLAQHPGIRTTTYAELLGRANQAPASVLPGLVAGSWVYGSMSTWIGDINKNRAWDMLCAAKQAYDLVMDSGRLSEQARNEATAQLAICESSDWFWWFGDYNPAAAVANFDRLFRRNLANLYCLMQLSPPVHLDAPLSAQPPDARDRASGGAAEGGAMRRAQQPTIS